MIAALISLESTRRAAVDLHQIATGMHRFRPINGHDRGGATVSRTRQTCTRTSTSQDSRPAEQTVEIDRIIDRIASLDHWHGVCRISASPAPQSQNPRRPHMPAVSAVAHAKGDYFVDYEEKVFEDVKA